MASLDAFVPMVRPEVMGCPEFTIRSAILNACREFCQGSHVWKETLESMPLVAEVGDYEIEQPSQQVVLMIYAARCRDNDLDFKTEAQMSGNWRTLTHTHPRVLVQESPITFRLVGIPEEDVDEGITGIRVAVQPATGATEVGDILLDDYGETIAYGAFSRLMRMPMKPWTQPEMSQYYDTLFQDGIGAAKIRAWKGYGKADMRLQNTKLNGAP